MIAAGAVLFGGLLVLALLCRLGSGLTDALVTDRIARLLAYFGIEPADPDVAAGDLLAIAGGGGLVLLLAAERAGVSIDAVTLVDLTLSAAGAGLALSWLIARAAPGAADDPVAADGPRALYTEVDPRHGDGDD